MEATISCLQASRIARDTLYDKFRSKLVTNPHLDRTLVSFQANRKLPFYSWLKYKEGFSAEFVRYVIRELGESAGVLLDPFAGTGAALFAGRGLGWDTIGIEILPVGFFGIEARLASESVSAKTLGRELEKIDEVEWVSYFDPEFQLGHVPITEGAFPPKTERSIAGYRAYCRRIRDTNVRKLFELACLSILESISYTRKDGQYLRWDSRAAKSRLKSNFNKGEIVNFDSAIKKKLREIYRDLCGGERMQSALFGSAVEQGRIGSVDLRRGSSLEILPRIQGQSVDLVVTSPPYCNRYDYTRTYALELVYLGIDADGIKRLRQNMLSCTVENKTKVAQFRNLYEHSGNGQRFTKVMRVFERQRALHEVISILRGFGAAGKLNNTNIPNMVENYFLEMAFVICELGRILRRGGRIVMVNDNVRYAGEEIPVDLILSDFGESFGMQTEHIWTLRRGKGNSSQQMGVHGRSELRKCVYVWRKA